MTLITPFFGQSNYDLALQIQGSLDNFIAFLNKNGVSNVSSSANNYQEEFEDNIINPDVIGYRYATKNIISSDGDYSHDDYSSEDYF